MAVHASAVAGGMAGLGLVSLFGYGLSRRSEPKRRDRRGGLRPHEIVTDIDRVRVPMASIQRAEAGGANPLHLALCAGPATARPCVPHGFTKEQGRIDKYAFWKAASGVLRRQLSR